MDCMPVRKIELICAIGKVKVCKDLTKALSLSPFK